MRVLISGAGIAGPALAYWLRHAGIEVTVVEHAAALRTGGYMVDFWGVGYDVAERMQLLEEIHRRGYLMNQVRIVDRDGHVSAWFDARAFRDITHDRFLSIPRSELSAIIYDAIQNDVEFIFGDSVSAIEQGKGSVEVQLRNGGTRTFDAVVGADGLHSNVRHLAFPPTPLLHLNYNVAACTVRGYPHREENVYVGFALPGAQIARYALRDNRTTFFFILATDGEGWAHDGTARQKEMLRSRFAGAGWETDEILDWLERTEDFYFDEVAQVRLPSWSQGRVALVGDAAYCPSLLAGEGAGLGMAGAYVLARELSLCNGDIERAFRNYDAALRTFIEKKQDSARGFARFFAPATRFGLIIRNAMTNALRIPYIGPRMLASSLRSELPLPPIRAG